MTTNSRQCAWVLTVAAGMAMAISGGAAPAVAAPFFQDHDQSHDQDYSKNKRYQQGVREGHSDHARNLDHSKKRHFKKDEDQKSYESGYQKGYGN